MSDDEEMEAEQEVQRINKKLKKGKASSFFTVVRETAFLTFLAEWGDRSQITTIALATDETYRVMLGSLLGHLVCTSIAVLGGKLISEKISEKWVKNELNLD